MDNEDRSISGNRSMRRRHIAFKAIIIVLVLLMIEVIVRILAYAGLCNIRTFQTEDRIEQITFVGDIDPHFGVWHKANASVAVKTPRGEVTYETNAHGMRDRPRAVTSDAPERVVVLGDSFIEGCYVEEHDRITDVLEEKTGVEFLNFGTSGSFGSIQEWLLYKHLATRFDHTRVCLFLLPDNDFADNDPAAHSPDRYRPYLRAVDGTYEVTYPIPFAAQSNALSSKMSPGRKFRRRLYNSWYSLNIIVHRDSKAAVDPVRRWVVDASYDRYTPTDLERLLFTYRQISAVAEGRPMHIFVIPRDKDFMAYQTDRLEGRIVTALSAFAEASPGIEVVDLLPYFVAYAREHDISYKRFFLGFDPHWSPLGHRVAADAVREALHESGFTTQ
jgi:hypothetical protein